MDYNRFWPLSSAIRKVSKSGKKLHLFQVSICCVCNYTPYRVLYKIIEIYRKKFFSLLALSILFTNSTPPPSTHPPTHTHFRDHKRRTKTKCFIQGLKIHFSRSCPRQPSCCLLSQLLDNIASKIRWMQRPLISTMAENIWTSLKLVLIFTPKLLDD